VIKQDNIAIFSFVWRIVNEKKNGEKRYELGISYISFWDARMRTSEKK
jgi:hypothetical protein